MIAANVLTAVLHLQHELREPKSLHMNPHAVASRRIDEQIERAASRIESCVYAHCVLCASLLASASACLMLVLLFLIAKRTTDILLCILRYPHA
jgi:hypothetical protein